MGVPIVGACVSHLIAYFSYYLVQFFESVGGLALSVFDLLNSEIKLLDLCSSLGPCEGFMNFWNIFEVDALDERCFELLDDAHAVEVEKFVGDLVIDLDVVDEAVKSLRGVFVV